MRINNKVTIGSSPFNLATGLTGTQMTGFGRVSPVFARAVSIQAQPSNAGLTYVMDGIYGVQSDGISPRIPSKAAATDVTATLGASASATQPGSQYSDYYEIPNGVAGVDVSRTWVDGGTPGDIIIYSFDIVETHL